MYYIREDPGTIQKEIEDQNGKIWHYKETRLETEFVWRNDDTVGRHVSATYNDETTTDPHSYISIPEVAGAYTGKHYHNADGFPESTDYNSSVFYGLNQETHQLEDNQPFRNGFLEFFVYNVYEPVNIAVTVKKVAEEDVIKTSADTLPGATFRLEKYANSTYQGKEDGWTDITIEDSTNQSSGVFKFEGLTEGYYQLVETETPEGYIKVSNNPRFHVKKIDGSWGIVLVGPDGADLEETVTDLLKVVNDNETHTLTVGNTPGAVLPNTGGPGTGALYLLGLMLTSLAGAGLMLRRRKSAHF